MKAYILSFLMVSLVFIGCKSTQPQPVNTLPQLENLVNTKSFEIESQFATPALTNTFSQLNNANLLGAGSTTGQINLIGNANFLRFKNDTISAFLPYYGEQQVGSSFFTGEVAIEFDDIPQDYTVKVNKKDITIEFEINDKRRAERYDVFLKLFPSNTSIIRVVSNKRTPITYRGRILPINEDEQD